MTSVKKISMGSEIIALLLGACAAFTALGLAAAWGIAGAVLGLAFGAGLPVLAIYAAAMRPKLLAVPALFATAALSVAISWTSVDALSVPMAIDERLGVLSSPVVDGLVGSWLAVVVVVLALLLTMVRVAGGTVTVEARVCGDSADPFRA